MVDRLSPIDRNFKTPQPVKQKQPRSPKTPPLTRREEPLGTMALHYVTPMLKCRYGRSIVPNRSELEDTAASKTKQPKSPKTPPLTPREEPLGTMALHYETPMLKRRYGRSIVPNRSELEDTAAGKSKTAEKP